MKLPIRAGAMCFALAISGIAAHVADFRAGAGKSEIQTTPDMWPLEGLTSQHDPLTVRVLLMDDNKARTAIVVLEQPSISDGTIAGVKASLTKLAGVSPENAIVLGTHTTSAPHANIELPGAGAARGGHWRYGGLRSQHGIRLANPGADRPGREWSPYRWRR